MKKLLVYLSSLVIGFSCIVGSASAASWVDVPESSIQIYDENSSSRINWSSANSYCSSVGGRLMTYPEAQDIYSKVPILGWDSPSLGCWTSSIYDNNSNYRYSFSFSTGNWGYFDITDDGNIAYAVCVKSSILPVPVASEIVVEAIDDMTIVQDSTNIVVALVTWFLMVIVPIILFILILILIHRLVLQISYYFENGFSSSSLDYEDYLDLARKTNNIDAWAVVNDYEEYCDWNGDISFEEYKKIKGIK